MEKLDNLDALEKLATEVNKVHSLCSNSTKAIEAQNAYASKSSMWDKLKWGYAKKVAQIGADVYNQEYEILPDTIQISPQIACIFAREISDYEKRTIKS